MSEMASLPGLIFVASYTPEQEIFVVELQAINFNVKAGVEIDWMTDGYITLLCSH